jgi:hypothetical protein
MNTSITLIAKEAGRLPAADRIKLVEYLLATLDKLDAEIDQAWADESERRLDACLRGETTARDAKDVLALTYVILHRKHGIGPPLWRGPSRPQLHDRAAARW